MKVFWMDFLMKNREMHSRIKICIILIEFFSTNYLNFEIFTQEMRATMANNQTEMAELKKQVK